MIQKNSNWNDKIEVQKGDFAEDIVDGFLKSKGYIIYKPEQQDKAHAFDRIAVRDKKDILLTECKAKASRKYYPDTGFDYRSYLEYKKISDKYKLPFFVYFIDENKGEIYGNLLSRLEVKKVIGNKTYPSIENNKHRKTWEKIIYFPLENMISIAKLTPEQVAILKDKSNRNYKY